MKLTDIEEFANCISEGFYADKIYNEKDFVRAHLYAESVKIGRDEIKKDGLNCGSIYSKLEHIHRYMRFLTWLRIQYGNRVVHSAMEAEAFFYKKLDEIAKDTEDFVLFWGWLRKVTLSEGSKFFMG